MIDTKAIEEHIRGILVALGDDPDREGLRERLPSGWPRCMRRSSRA